MVLLSKEMKRVLKIYFFNLTKENCRTR